MRNATRSMVSTIGILCGISGLEHGFFEVLQGNTAAEFHLVNGRPMIYASGDSLRFWPYGYELAFTIIPNDLVTGILAMLASLLVIVCAVGRLHRKYGWSRLSCSPRSNTCLAAAPRSSDRSSSLDWQPLASTGR